MDKYKLWSELLHQLRAVCRNFDAVWISRQRRFDTFNMFCSLIELVSTSDQSYLNMLRDFNSNELPPSASSFCEAREKFPAYVIQEILSESLRVWDEFQPEIKSWYGFELFVIDGSKLTVPRPLQGQGFKTPPAGFYPQALLSSLLRVRDRVICASDFSPNMSERNAALRLTEGLGQKDLVIFDRGYLSLELLCAHKLKCVEGLYKVQGGQTFQAIADFRTSELTDQIVDIKPSQHTHRKVCKALDVEVLPAVKLRLIKYFARDEMHILATTILCNSISAKAFVELYRERWKIEELYKIFKQRLNIEGFHSKKQNGVEQEVHTAAILWNLTRKIEAFCPKELFKKNLLLFKNITLPNQLYTGSEGLCGKLQNLHVNEPS